MNLRDLLHPSDSSCGRASTSGQKQSEASSSKSHTMLSVPPSRAPSPGPNRHDPGYTRKASIVLIGMRGVGKTTLGTIAAKALGWELIDTDRLIEKQFKVSIATFIETQGWDQFREIESGILETSLRSHRTAAVIACGGGIVELSSNRQLLQKFRAHGPVIHVLREKDAVLEFLRNSSQYPPLLHETAKEAWDRRESLFRECCSFEFVSLTVPIPPTPEYFGGDMTADQTFALKPVEEDFFRLLRFIHGVDTNKVVLSPRGPRTYFLALTYDDIGKAVPVLEDISLGIDLWEIRGDLLASYDLTFLSFQISTLRHHSTLPILLTWRTVSQGGKYPDVSSKDPDAMKAYQQLLHHALRLGVEYIDLEITLPESTFSEIVAQKGNTSVLGSYHDWKGNLVWMSPQTRQLYDRMVRSGSDIVKIASMAKTFEDNMSLRQFVGTLDRNATPLLAINMGPEGKISRVLNPILSPLSHPLLPRAAAPGQISFYESQTILYLTGLLPAKKYYLFGRSISHSMSPTIHNAAFATLGLPHTYELKETKTVEELREVLTSPSFGGASVTIPYKVDIIPLLTHISRHARIIGAVNTVTPHSGGRGFTGDNTDWRAIKTCLQRSLTPANVVTSTTTALVLGAGGTSRAALYALHQIGVINIYIYNRTRKRAELLANDFTQLDPLLRIHVLDKLDVPLPFSPMPTMIVSTIPATASGTMTPSTEPIDIGLRSEHLSSAGGVAIELAYERRMTRLLELAQQKRDQGISWAVVEGIELLLEQGYEQCRIWTSRRAPKSKVREKVLEVYAKSKGSSTTQANWETPESVTDLGSSSTQLNK
ncbi:pentafunctional arom polypeptide [Moniliophthora roreri MCA 2997]|uniref:shikimate kinase n=1 Tax=Moniliophthora roreri (strain MCA 2997) TaxID=1381753 RepID=V2XMI3_MONRO|nr:pentafunctional arom polypeptide [Moniliophthora roreri MCA 2997]